MKTILSAIIITLSAFAVNAQNVTCANFRDGKFKSIYNGATTIIYRKGSHESDYTLKGKDSVRMDFIVKWIDDCTYTLIADPEEYKKYPAMPRNIIMTFKMSNLKKNSYTQTVTVNVSSQIFTSEIELLPNN